MFRPKEMKKLRLVTLDEKKYGLIEGLHQEGIVEIEDMTTRLEDPEWEQYLDSGEAGKNASEITSLILRSNKILDTFKSARTTRDVSRLEKIQSFLNPDLGEEYGKKKGKLGEVINEADSFIKEIEKKLQPLENRLEEIESQEADIKSFKNQIKDYEGLDVPLKYIEETEFSFSSIGKISNDEIDTLNEELEEKTNKFLLETSEIDEKNSVFILLGLKEEKTEINESIREHTKWRFEPPEWVKKTPRKSIKESNKKLEKLEEEKRETKEEIREIREENTKELNQILNRLETEKERAEIQESFTKTKQTSILEGWIPSDKTHKIDQIIKHKAEGYAFYEIKDPENPEEVPTKLDNPKIFQPFETLVEMFNLPGYDEIDPTPVFAISFVIFVGLCLTDSGYGLLNLALGAILLKGPGKASRKIKDLGLILLISGGVSSIVWGIMTGGFFGSLLGPTLGGLGILPEGWYPWVSPLTKKAVDVLVLSILIGVGYLGLGLIIGIYQNITRGETRKAIVEQLTWLVILMAGTPLVVQALTSETFAGGLNSAMSVLWGQIALIAIIAALGTAVYLSGPIAIMDLPGFFGDIISFARLLALAVATGGIASIVNILSFDVLPSFHPALYLLSVPLFLIGHIGNYAFQTLGAFIHSMRLQYVEFFGTFYAGTGEKFKPFSMNKNSRDD